MCFTTQVVFYTVFTIFLGLSNHVSAKFSRISDDYPNPWTNVSKCRRTFPSFICDPDRLMPTAHVTQLDDQLWKFGRSSECLCENCGLARGGVPIAIALMRFGNALPKDEYLQEIAEMLRSKWGFGTCDNDILVLVTEEKARVSAGKRAQKILQGSQFEKLFSDGKISEKMIFEFLNQSIAVVHKAYENFIHSPGLQNLDSDFSSTNESNLNRLFDSKNEKNGKEEDKILSSNKGSKIKSISDDEKLRTISDKISLTYSSPTNSLGSSSDRFSGMRPLVVAEEFDDSELPHKKTYLHITLIVGSILAVLVVVLLALSLIVWYFRTRTGTIDTGMSQAKVNSIGKEPNAIEATKYKPCNQTEDADTL